MLRKTTVSLALAVFASVMVSDLLSFFLTFTCFLFNKSYLLIGSCVVNILIMFMLIYMKSWDEGYRDPNRVKYGRMNKFLLKGFVAGLIADIPFFIAYVFMLITVLFKMKELTFYSKIIFYGFNLQFFYVITQLQNIPAVLVIILLPIPLVTGISYYIGYKQIEVLSKVIYKKKKSK